MPHALSWRAVVRADLALLIGQCSEVAGGKIRLVLIERDTSPLRPFLRIGARQPAHDRVANLWIGCDLGSFDVLIEDGIDRLLLGAARPIPNVSGRTGG